jgi:hypothetical protein
MQAGSVDPGVQVIGPILGDDVEGWPCPGAALPPLTEEEVDGLPVEPTPPPGGVKLGRLAPPGGNGGPGVCNVPALGLPPLAEGLVPVAVPLCPSLGDVGPRPGLTLLSPVGEQSASTPGPQSCEPPKPPVGVQSAPVLRTQDFDPLGTLVEDTVVPCPGLLGLVDVMLALLPPIGVVCGWTMLPPGGTELGVLPPGVMLGPWP